MFGRQGAAKPTILAIDPCPVLFMIDDFSSVRSPRLSDLRGDQPPCPRIEGNIYLQEPLIYVYIYIIIFIFIIFIYIYYYYLLFIICYFLFIIYYLLLLLYNHHLNQFGSPNWESINISSVIHFSSIKPYAYWARRCFPYKKKGWTPSIWGLTRQVARGGSWQCIRPMLGVGTDVDLGAVICTMLPWTIPLSMDWIKGKFTGKPHI